MSKKKLSIEELSEKWNPRKNTGKTKFNRDKPKGVSWTKLRQEAYGVDYICTEAWVK